MRPHRNSPPALVTSLANVKLPVTGTGDGRSEVVPSPSWPLALYPQQYGVPAGVSPQTDSACTFASMLAKEIPPETATGELALRTVLAIPSPIFPPKLVPQQYAAPEVVSPQV